MSLALDVGLFLLGLLLIVPASEWLVESTLGASYRLGVSAFLLSVVVIGFDAENLAVGAMATVEQAAGIALGSVVGSAMVAVALAFGLTALIVPLEFDRVPGRVVALPVVLVGLLTVLALDGRLSRPDGVILLGGYALSIAGLVRWEREGAHIAPVEAVEDEARETSSTAAAVGWMLASVAGVVVGGELLVEGARPIVRALGWTDTTFGMTVLALLVSAEELARELPAALRGRPDISAGNVVGSALAFFGFNAGVIACIRPLRVDPATRSFYLPVCAATVAVVALFLVRRRVPRWAGALLVALYAAFALGGGLMG